jgi:hypothetical protein
MKFTLVIVSVLGQNQFAISTIPDYTQARCLEAVAHFREGVSHRLKGYPVDAFCIPSPDNLTIVPKTNTDRRS